MLNKKLQKWVEQKIITQEQANRILATEQENKRGFAWKTLFAIAGTFIGLGFILLIGANWDAIPNNIKLLADFTIFAALLGGSYWSIINNRKNIRELFLILSFLMVGGTIGLIAQIFNMSGGWQSFAISWALLSTPFVVLSKLLVSNVLWLLLLCSGIDWEVVASFLQQFNSPLGVVVVLTLFFAGLNYVGNKLYKVCNHVVVLPKALANLAFLMMYFQAILGGAFNGNISASSYSEFPGHIFVLVFLAIRMAMAFNRHSLSGFKNNAILVELYILWIFVSSFGNLLLSGIGLVFAGILLILLIYVLKRTSTYIKGMENFNEK